MENASKALLIAGSILVVILLIAMGVRVLNSTSGTTDATEQTMKSTEIAQFNSKFTQYVGTKNNAEVMALLNAVISNNATTAHEVKVNGKDAKTLINNVTASTYTIEIKTTDYTNGFITNITIPGLN